MLNLITMNTLEFEVQELNETELEETNGGIIFLIIAAALLLTSCTVTVVVGDDNKVTTSTKVDSTANGNTADIKAK
jgi:hypothetical protein